MRLDLQNVIQAQESTYTVNHFYFINYLLVFLKLKYLVLSVISLLIFILIRLLTCLIYLNFSLLKSRFLKCLFDNQVKPINLQILDHHVSVIN
jgi:hypothetical protein